MARKSSKKSRGKTKTVAPEDQAEVRPITSSQPNLKIDANRQEQHKNTLRGYDQKISTLTGARRKAIQTMKAEGYNTDAIRDLIKAERGDPLEQIDYYQQFALGLKHNGSQFQLAVHDANFDDPVAQARSEAKQAALNGRSPECRWPEGSPEHEVYMTVYAETQAGMVPGADKLTEKERKDAVAAGRAAT